MRLLIDMDDVIARTLDKCVALYNDEYNTNITRESLTEWDLDGSLPEGTSMEKYFTMNDFFCDLKVIDGAKKYLKKLHDEGDEIFLVSASTPCGVLAKSNWREKHFPWIKWDNMIFTVRKDLICGDLMLDDGVHNLENSIVTFPVLFTAPHNLKEERFMRVNTWEEFYSLVRNLR